MRCSKEALEKEAKPVKDEDDCHTSSAALLSLQKTEWKKIISEDSKKFWKHFGFSKNFSAVCCSSTKSSLNLSRKEVTGEGTGACVLTCSQEKE